MLNVSQQYINATLASNRRITARVVVDTREFTTDKIETITYESTVCDGEKFILGGGFTNTAEVNILEIVEGVLENTPVKIYISLFVDNRYVELPLGHFFVKEVLIDRNANKTTLNVKDNMFRAEQPYISQLTYPTTTRAIFEEIATQLQVSVSTRTVMNDYSINEKINKVTIKEMLIYLAQISGGFVRFDRYGELEITRLQNTGRKISKANYFLKGLTKNEIDFRIGGMKNTIKHNDTEVVLSSGRDTGVQVDFTNPLMTQNILDRLYNEFRQLNYFPFDLKWQGDASLECIDWVSVEHATNQWINVPMLSYKLSFNGGLTAISSAKANTQSQGEYAYKGVLTKKIEYMEAMMSGTNPIYMDIAEPQNAKNGDKWFKPNGGTVQLLEYENGQWVKKADTADINEIVDTFTTDEVIASKLYGAIANFIEVNANKIVAGDIDLQRLRIMDGAKEILAIRDGKIIANLGIEEQLTPIREKQALLEQQLQAEMLRDIGDEFIREFNTFISQVNENRTEDAEKLLALANRVVVQEANLGQFASQMNFLDGYTTFSNEGMRIGSKDSTTSILVANDGITIFSNGQEVASFKEGYMKIENGIFTKSIQVGTKWKIVPYTLNTDILGFYYLEGGIEVV